MYNEDSKARTPPRHEDQRIFVAVVAEVGEDGVVSDELKVSQRLVVLLSDELQCRVGNQRVVTVQVESLQRKAGLQDPDELRALHLQGHDVHSEVGAHSNLNKNRCITFRHISAVTAAPLFLKKKKTQNKTRRQRRVFTIVFQSFSVGVLSNDFAPRAGPLSTSERRCSGVRRGVASRRHRSEVKSQKSIARDLRLLSRSTCGGVIRGSVGQTHRKKSLKKCFLFDLFLHHTYSETHLSYTYPAGGSVYRGAAGSRRRCWTGKLERQASPGRA